jgi:type III secretion protein L
MTFDATNAGKPTGAWEGPAKASPLGPVVRAEDLHLWTDAQGYLAEAKRALDQAHQQIESASAAARAKGYAEGWAAGSRDLFEFLAQTKVQVDDYHAQLEANLRALAVQVIKEVIGNLDAGDAIAAATARALQTQDLGAEVALHVAPEIYRDVRLKLEKWLNGVSASAITLREDPKLSPKGCKLVSNFCTVDVSIDNQLALLAESLRGTNIGVRE